MQRIMLFIVVLTVYPLALQAQPFNEHPLEGFNFREESDLKDICLMWHAKSTADSMKAFKLFPYDDSIPNIYSNHNTLKLPGKIKGDFDIISGEFIGDNFYNEDIIIATINDTNFLELTLLRTVPGISSWGNIKKIAMNQRQAINSFDPSGNKIRLIGCNLDSDSTLELVLAYWNENANLEIVIFDEENETLVEKASYIAATFAENVFLWRKYFDITAADFDNDLTDELLIVGPQQTNDQGIRLIADIYDYNSAVNEITPTSTNNLVFDLEDRLTRVAVSAGKIRNSSSFDVIVGFQDFINNQITSLVIPFTVKSDLTGINIPTDEPFKVFSSFEDQGYSMSIEIADIMNDDLGEAIVAHATQIWVFNLNGQNQLELLTTSPHYGDVSELNNRRKIAVTNMDVELDPEHPDFEMQKKVEIVVFDRKEIFLNGEKNLFNIKVFKIEDDALILKAQKSDTVLNVFNFSATPAALVAGQLRPEHATLGEPTVYSKTEILQPLVILNAPPIHFDILNSTAYDLSDCYNGGDCGFTATYTRQNSQSMEVSTEVVSDWAISREASLSLDIVGIKAEASLKETYGEHFSKVNGHSTTITISVSIEATDDDRIYATVVDYDLWEYPVFIGSNLFGHIAVIVPKVTENRWFPSKSWSGQSYRPSHEVGNILSYTDYPNLDENEDLAIRIKGGNDDSFVLDANSSIDWTLDFTDFSTQQITTSWSNKTEAKASLELFGFKAEVTGEYSDSEIETHKTTVEDGISLAVHLGGIDLTIGETGYRVTPYSYWAKNGALVLDYSVIPETADPGFTPTWWQEIYEEKPDPAFILPWRYDPEKGFTLQNEEKREQTRDIIFDPQHPRPGEVTTIKTRVHNYSLTPTSAPVKVKFFIGDPDGGGTLLIGTGGEEEILTSDHIPARGSSGVEIEWLVPEGLDLFQRIYAVIDPSSEIDEIHEENNRGWTIFQGEGISTAIDNSYDKNTPYTFTLKQNYPNPFNPETIIQYQLPKASQTKLAIYNLLGQLIVTLVDEQQPVGVHSVQWDGKNQSGRKVASGVYLYRLEVNEFVQTKKLALLR